MVTFLYPVFHNDDLPGINQNCANCGFMGQPRAGFGFAAFCFMKLLTKRLLQDILLKLLLVSILFVAAIFIFGFLADEAVLENEDLFDSRAFHFFHAYTTPGLIHLAAFISFFGSPKFFIPAYSLLCGYFLWQKKKRLSLDILLIGISSSLLMFGLKNIFKRHRPDFPILQTLNNYSFPSGHSLCSFVFCSILI